MDADFLKSLAHLNLGGNRNVYSRAKAQEILADWSGRTGIKIEY